MWMKLSKWLLPVLSGALFGLAWPEIGDLTLLIFLAFVPLFIFEEIIIRNEEHRANLKIFLGAYVAFFLFNYITTSWIRFASLPGMLMAEILNAFFMALLFTFFSRAKRRLGQLPGYLGFIFLWLGFEWMHYHWELSWVWLTLGNVFANDYTWIQWYEWTGVFGGSLWVLIVNVFIVLFILRSTFGSLSRRNLIIRLTGFLLLIIMPILYSQNTYESYVEKGSDVDIVVVQPNIDPYKKFSVMAESEQIDLLVELARTKADKNVDFVVCPETAWPGGYYEHQLDIIYGIVEFRKFLNDHPNTRMVTGLSSIRLYAPGEEITSTARYYEDGSGNYYDYYNTALQVDQSGDIQLYHKSKLVLGVEKMPFGTLLKPLESLSLDLGGASGTLGSEDEPINFKSVKQGTDETQVAPVICYESVYGEYVSEYIRKGAGLIFIITNDGWWEDTPGYKQHLAYARIRAIENRRSIARSANTGISAFLNQRGDVIKPTGWWERTAIRHKIKASEELTFYTRHGDYIGRVAAFFSILFIVLTIARTLQKKSKVQK